MLRRRPASRVDGGDDLHLRVHLVRAMRRGVPRRSVPELRRGPAASTRSTGGSPKRQPGFHTTPGKHRITPDIASTNAKIHPGGQVSLLAACRPPLSCVTPRPVGATAYLPGPQAWASRRGWASPSGPLPNKGHRRRVEGGRRRHRGVAPKHEEVGRVRTLNHIPGTGLVHR